MVMCFLPCSMSAEAGVIFLKCGVGTKYANLTNLFGNLSGLGNQIEAGEARIQALETEDECLDEKKAPLFVAVAPLHSKTDVIPQQLYIEKVLSRSATTIRFDSNGAYIEFYLSLSRCA